MSNSAAPVPCQSLGLPLALEAVDTFAMVILCPYPLLFQGTTDRNTGSERKRHRTVCLMSTSYAGKLRRKQEIR